ncbi:MAG: nucleotidyltransferase domain-containing protein [Chloroflexota bacterium]
MTELNYPNLAEPYNAALREAVPYVLARFSPVIAIIVAGSIIDGKGDQHSDIDTFIIFESDYRQRIQKFFGGVRFELLANPPDFIPLYFEQEKRDGGGSTAYMLATGHVLMCTDEAMLTDFQAQARALLAGKPAYSPKQLTMRRYFLADNFENGLDLRHRDPIMGRTLILSVLKDMLIYDFQKQGKWTPRHKDLLMHIRRDNPNLARMFADCISAQGDTFFDLACQIADMTLGTRGFFEWESDKDYLE